MNPNSILALDQLPFDVVRKLACSSNALAARHLHPVSRWPWSKQRHLLTCDVCAYTFAGNQPRHAGWCHVGRTQEVAQQIIKLGSEPLPKHIKPATEQMTPVQALAQMQADCSRWFDEAIAEYRDELPEGLLAPVRQFVLAAWIASATRTITDQRAELRRAWTEANERPSDPDRVAFLEPGLRITEVSSHERSDAKGSAGERRADGGPSGSSPTVAPAPEYGEPLAWDPVLRRILDRYNMVVADLSRADLTPEEKQKLGRRIVACVNFLAGSCSNEWLRDASQKVAESMGEREEFQGILLDLSSLGWFVEENGARITFPDYGGAKHYFNARVHMVREIARPPRNESAPCNGVSA